MTLLERESQLGSLRQYAAEARARTGRFVLISGEGARPQRLVAAAT